MFTGYLQDTISIRDVNIAKPMKENFYHGLLLGLLKAESRWRVKSDQQSGAGYADILLKICKENIGCIFEIKYAEKGNFDTACSKAMQQIKDKAYITALRQDGIKIIHQYGVVCYKKTCKIVHEQYNI